MRVPLSKLLLLLSLICISSISIIFRIYLTAAASNDHQLPTVGPDAVSTPTPPPTQTTFPRPTIPAARMGERTTIDASAIDRTHGRDQTRYYTVKADDTVWTIALDLGIDIDAMGCLIAPDFQPSQPLVIGDLLESPPDLTCHVVNEGEDFSFDCQRVRANAGRNCRAPMESAKWP